MALQFPANPVVGQPSGTYEYTTSSGVTITYTWDGTKWTAAIPGGGSGEVPSGGGADYPTTPTPGDLFFDTDVDILYYWDGAQWVPVAVAPPDGGSYVDLSGATMTGALGIDLPLASGQNTQALQVGFDGNVNTYITTGGDAALTGTITAAGYSMASLTQL